MEKKAVLSILKQVLLTVLLVIIGCTGIVFGILYVNSFDNGLFHDYYNFFVGAIVVVTSLLTVLSIIFYQSSKEFVYKLILITNILISFTVLLLYILKIIGFFDKIRSVEDFRAYISSFGGYAVIIFILLQFLQVVILPIPSFITVGAGVLLFGALKGSIYSCLGIISGSICAFFIGKFFGVKVAKWLVGEKDLAKGLNLIKGKDKIVLTFMFLFPFFPDDILCFVAGITTISKTFFIIMIFIVRVITVFASSYSMNNSIIPYNTWWGILLWVLFFILTIILTVIVYKYGNKIEQFLVKKIRTKKDK